MSDAWLSRTELMMIVRVALRQELAGYAEYARRVRYRLIPGVW